MFVPYLQVHWGDGNGREADELQRTPNRLGGKVGLSGSRPGREGLTVKLDSAAHSLHSHPRDPPGLMPQGHKDLLPSELTPGTLLHLLLPGLWNHTSVLLSWAQDSPQATFSVNFSPKQHIPLFSSGLSLLQFSWPILPTCHLLWSHPGLFMSLFNHLTSLGLTVHICKIGLILSFPPSNKLWEETRRSRFFKESYSS